MLYPRQDSSGDAAFQSQNGSYYDSFWYTKTGYIIKYVIFGLILLTFLVWFIGGYYHAQRRMKRGLPPLAYHRWLVPRHQRARFEPHLQSQYALYQQPQPYGYGYPAQPNQYPMQAYPEQPPPLYNYDVPPIYQPPPGASKAAPEQQYMPSSSQYAPPPGPPPLHSSPESQAPHGSQTTGVVSDEPLQPAQAHHTGSSNPFRL